MKVYIDGSSTGLYGYLFLNGKKKVVQDYPMTNNQAEWLALLILLMDLEPNSKVSVYSDSQIVVHQYTGEWETKNETLKHLKEVCHLVANIKKLKITLHWVPRGKNSFGKLLAKIVAKNKKKRKKLSEKIKRGW